MKLMRLYQQTVNKMFLVLLAMRYRVGYTMADCARWASSSYPSHSEADPEIVALTKQIFRFDGQTLNQELDELIREMAGILREAGKPCPDGDLIDAMVRVLQMPYPRSTLTQRQLQELRAAILVPSEMAKVATTLAERELRCHTCGHHFESGEMASVARESGDVFLFCTRCQRPSLVACDEETCEDVSMEVPTNLRKVLQKRFTCPTHGEHKEGEAEAPSPARQRIAEQLRRDRARIVHMPLTWPTPANEPVPAEGVAAQLQAAANRLRQAGGDGGVRVTTTPPPPDVRWIAETFATPTPASETDGVEADPEPDFDDSFDEGHDF